MKTPTLAAALLVLATMASTQQGTVPAGLLTSEGNDNYGSTLGYLGANSTSNTYYTVVDATNTGAGRVFHTLSLRRDGSSPSDPAYVGRSVHMTIRMAHGDYGQVANNDLNPEASLLRSAWSTVFIGKSVNLPNWANPPAGGTAPFNLTFPLDVAFPYNGVDAVVFQFRCTPSNLPQSTPFPIDAQEETSYALGTQTRAGTGCTATGRTTPMSHGSYLTNYGPLGRSVWQLYTQLAPANAPVLYVIGASNPNAPIGACERLLAAPTLVLAAGAADASGFVNLTTNFRHQDALIGASVWSQAVAYDGGQPGVPFALSNSQHATYPANPAPTEAIASGQLRTAAAGFPTSVFLFKGSSLVIGLGY